jgi:hypothetical protein
MGDFTEDAMKVKIMIAALLLTVASAACEAKGLPFINDNFGKALEEARQHKQPIFVEVWAPW